MTTELLKSLSLDQIAELTTCMQDWVLDCQWADVDEEYIDQMSDEELLRGVSLHYDGGIDQFIRDNEKG